MKPWKPGQSGNPSGMPKGTLTNAALANCIADALCQYTGKKDREEAIRTALAEGLKSRRIKVGDAIEYLIKCLPKQVDIKPLGPVLDVGWPEVGGAKDKG